MPVYLEKEEKWTKDGRKYQFRCYYTDIYGKRHQKESGLFLKKKEAEQAERDFLSSVEKREEINTNISFEYVYHEWLEYKASQNKSQTDYGRVKRADKYILSYFKKYNLYSIKINIINTWNDYIFSQDVCTKHKNRIISEMKELLEFAETNYDFDKKVAAKLHKQKIEKTEIKKDSEINFLTYSQYLDFIKLVDNKNYSLMFNFLYYTGLRYGEFNALTWEDINFEKKTVTINKSLSIKFRKNKFTPNYEQAKKYNLKVVEGKDYIITDPKTKNSFRTVNLDDELIEALKELKREEEKIYGFNSHFFVFGNVKYIPYTTFKRNLDKYMDLYKEKRITPHGFRHSHVSLLIHLGCDVYEVADRIGDTPREVEKTYYHMFPEKKKHTIDVINQLKNKK